MPVLLLSGASGSRRILVGENEKGFRRAFGQFVESWGEDAVWFDEQAGVLGSEGGVTMARWRARWLGSNPLFGLVVLVDAEPADVYLVDDAAMAGLVVGALGRPGVEFDLVPLEPLEPGEAEAGDPLDGLPAIRLAPGRFTRPQGPRAAFSLEICSRCEDHPLHEEPLFDARIDDGRVCVACGTLSSLRRSA